MSREPSIGPEALDRRELADLAFQAVAWAELDQLYGVASTVVPTLEPFATLAQASPTPTREPNGSPIASFAARAAAVLAVPAQRLERAPNIPAAAAPVPATVSETTSPDERTVRAEREARLRAIHERIQGCVKCALAQGRTKVVPGQGDPMAELVFVGEGPGETEDRTGLAFVGKAGELLTKMIGAMGLTRDQVFIANVVKCRPPGNRPPAPDEMATCLPYLEEQLAVIRPRVICALGKTAAVGLGLVRPTDSLGSARGRFHSWRNTPVMVTYHPSYLLRTPSDKRKAWEDLQKIFPHLTRRS